MFRIDLREIEDVDWLSALRPGAIRKLVDCGAIQMGLFDERNLFELEHPDWPDERLIACRNPELAKRRKAKRDSLLEATAAELDKVRRMVGRGRLHGKKSIGDRVGKILGQYKVGKYYTVEIRDDGFDYEVDEEVLSADVKKRAGADAALAAKRLERYRHHIESIAKKLCELRERLERGRLHGKDEIGVRVGRVVNKYKVAKHFELHIEDDSFHFDINQQKVDVERAFRCLKSVDLMVRPIRHRRERRVRAHNLLCMLAYYVQWHMIEAWRPLLFADEDQVSKQTRDPVAPAKRSKEAREKAADKQLEDGSPVHSFINLLKHLHEIVRNTCRCPDADSDKDDEASTFHKTTTPNPKQQRALDLLRGITVTTDVDSACPVLGATDNATSQAIGTLTLGASPAIAWESCTFPDGYNSNNTSYTPDVVGAGDGCLAPLKSTGNVHCLDESAIATCGSGGLADGDNAQDETCEQALNELVFSGDLNTFTMSFALVPNRASSRTYLSLGGTLASKVCD